MLNTPYNTYHTTRNIYRMSYITQHKSQIRCMVICHVPYDTHTHGTNMLIYRTACHTPRNVPYTGVHVCSRSYDIQRSPVHLSGAACGGSWITCGTTQNISVYHAQCTAHNLQSQQPYLQHITYIIWHMIHPRQHALHSTCHLFHAPCRM